MLRITHLAHRKSYLVIICPNSHEKKLGQVIICPNLVLSTIICPQNTICVNTSTKALYLPTVYLALFSLTQPYLGKFALNCPDFIICAIFTLHLGILLLRLHLYTRICAKNCRSIRVIIRRLFMEILHLKDWGYSWRYCI